MRRLLPPCLLLFMSDRVLPRWLLCMAWPRALMEALVLRLDSDVQSVEAPKSGRGSLPEPIIMRPDPAAWLAEPMSPSILIPPLPDAGPRDLPEAGPPLLERKAMSISRSRVAWRASEEAPPPGNEVGTSPPSSTLAQLELCLVRKSGRPLAKPVVSPRSFRRR